MQLGLERNVKLYQAQGQKDQKLRCQIQTYFNTRNQFAQELTMWIFGADEP